MRKYVSLAALLLFSAVPATSLADSSSSPLDKWRGTCAQSQGRAPGCAPSRSTGSNNDGGRYARAAQAQQAGWAAYNAGQFDLAVSYFRRANDIDPDRIYQGNINFALAAIPNQKGLAAYRAGDYGLAVDFFRQANAMYRDAYHEKNINLALAARTAVQGTAAYNAKDFSAALQYFRQANATYPDQIYQNQITMALAAVANQQSIDKARDTNQQLLNRARDRSHQLDDEGTSLLVAGYAEAAIGKLFDAHSLAPDDRAVTAHWLRAAAEVDLKQGRLESAVTNLRRALEYRPGDFAATERLQQVLASHPQQAASNAQLGAEIAKDVSAINSSSRAAVPANASKLEFVGLPENAISSPQPSGDAGCGDSATGSTVKSTFNTTVVKCAPAGSAPPALKGSVGVGGQLKTVEQHSQTSALIKGDSGSGTAQLGLDTAGMAAGTIAYPDRRNQAPAILALIRPDARTPKVMQSFANYEKLDGLLSENARQIAALKEQQHSGKGDAAVLSAQLLALTNQTNQYTAEKVKAGAEIEAEVQKVDRSFRWPKTVVAPGGGNP